MQYTFKYHELSYHEKYHAYEIQNYYKFEFKK